MSYELALHLFVCWMDGDGDGDGWTDVVIVGWWWCVVWWLGWKLEVGE
jgi:hypothetical protein